MGAMVEPLTGQMAEYLGVPNGLMVKQVAAKSEAFNAGFKARDVILKVGSDAVTTMSDWDRALRQNQGKAVQVTILREGKQLTLTLQVDSKRKTGEMEMEELFPAGDAAVVAELDPGVESGLESRLAQVFVNPQIDSQTAEELRRQVETLKDQLKMDTFKIDPKQMDEMKRQMEEFQKNFKPEDFQIDQKKMDEMKQQMQEWQKTVPATGLASGTELNPEKFRNRKGRSRRRTPFLFFALLSGPGIGFLSGSA